MHDHSDHHDEIGEPGREFKGRGDGVSPTLIGFIVLAVVTVIFIVQNSEPVTATFVFFDVETRLWVAIAVAIAIGAVLDRLFSVWWRRRKARE